MQCASSRFASGCHDRPGFAGAMATLGCVSLRQRERNHAYSDK
jgi:hypothetical protein